MGVPNTELYPKFLCMRLIHSQLNEIESNLANSLQSKVLLYTYIDITIAYAKSERILHASNRL